MSAKNPVSISVSRKKYTIHRGSLRVILGLREPKAARPLHDEPAHYPADKGGEERPPLSTG